MKKVEKLEKFIKDELLELGFTKGKHGNYQYKDINIWNFLKYSDEQLIMDYYDSKCDNNDMHYDTAFFTFGKKKDIKGRLKFIKDNQGELHKGYGCVYVNNPANV